MRPVSRMPEAAMTVWKPSIASSSVLSSSERVKCRGRNVQQRVAKGAAICQFAGVLGEDHGGAGRQRVVDMDRDRRQFALLNQQRQIRDQFLRAFDREGRDQLRPGRRCLRRQEGRSALAVSATPARSPSEGSRWR